MTQSYLSKLRIELDQLGCQALQIRFFSEISITLLSDILSVFVNSSCYYLEVLLTSTKEMTGDNLKKLFKTYSNFRVAVIHSSEEDKIVDFKDDCLARIIFTTTKFHSEACCGVINEQYFILNINSFTEVINFNSCLNKKIAIDQQGEIKNCPSMLKSFGNIIDTSLLDVIQLKEFKKTWKINKDKIDICKDCEYRYICTDCRAYISSKKINSKPLKCSYDPYIGKWKE